MHVCTNYSFQIYCLNYSITYLLIERKSLQHMFFLNGGFLIKMNDKIICKQYKIIKKSNQNIHEINDKSFLLICFYTQIAKHDLFFNLDIIVLTLQRLI